MNSIHFSNQQHNTQVIYQHKLTTQDIYKKWGRARNIKLIELSKEIWEYLILKGIAIAAEYIVSVTNTETDEFQDRRRTLQNGS